MYEKFSPTSNRSLKENRRKRKIIEGFLKRVDNSTCMSGKKDNIKVRFGVYSGTFDNMPGRKDTIKVGHEWNVRKMFAHQQQEFEGEQAEKENN